jgi:glycosyltransferase involved in cell wall biosynthesis
MKNSLSLCVICKNEEKNIGTLLESVSGDLFDQIVVCDTGSTDGTLDVLKKYGVQIEHFEWVDDFSAARNFAFSKATSDYIMWLDSDDYLKKEDYQKLVELKNRLHEYPIWLLKYEYAHDEFGVSICSFYRERIVKRSLNIQWEQPIHEYMPLLHPYSQVEIEVHHNKKESHTKRNLSILEKIVEKNPNFSRNVYYLGKEYFDSGDYERGKEYLNKFLDMPDGWSENRFGACIRLAEYAMSVSDIKEAKINLYRSMEIDPLKAKTYFYLGDISLGEKNYHEAIHWYKICVSMGRSSKSLDIVEPKFSTWLPYLQMCLAFNNLGMIKEAAEANEKALQYRPKDIRLLNNKKIFLNSLKEKYPFLNNENYHVEEQERIPLGEFKGKVAWYTSTDRNFASTRIRMININNFLKKKGFKSEFFSYGYEDSYDIIITGKLFSKDHLEEIKHWKRLGIKVVADINEDIIQFPYVSETLLECDKVVCCSYELKNKIYNKLKIEDIEVIEDPVEYYSGGYDD